MDYLQRQKKLKELRTLKEMLEEELAEVRQEILDLEE